MQIQQERRASTDVDSSSVTPRLVARSEEAPIFTDEAEPHPDGDDPSGSTPR